MARRQSATLDMALGRNQTPGQAKPTGFNPDTAAAAAKTTPASHGSKKTSIYKPDIHDGILSQIEKDVPFGAFEKAGLEPIPTLITRFKVEGTRREWKAISALRYGGQCTMNGKDGARQLVIINRSFKDGKVVIDFENRALFYDNDRKAYLPLAQSGKKETVLYLLSKLEQKKGVPSKTASKATVESVEKVNKSIDAKIASYSVKCESLDIDERNRIAIPKVQNVMIGLWNELIQAIGKDLGYSSEKINELQNSRDSYKKAIEVALYNIIGSYCESKEVPKRFEEYLGEFLQNGRINGSFFAERRNEIAIKKDMSKGIAVDRTSLAYSSGFFISSDLDGFPRKCRISTVYKNIYKAFDENGMPVMLKGTDFPAYNHFRVEKSIYKIDDQNLPNIACGGIVTGINTDQNGDQKNFCWDPYYEAVAPVDKVGRSLKAAYEAEHGLGKGKDLDEPGASKAAEAAESAEIEETSEPSVE